jgi:hypothetical protein
LTQLTPLKKRVRVSRIPRTFDNRFIGNLPSKKFYGLVVVSILRGDLPVNVGGYNGGATHYRTL